MKISFRNQLAILTVILFGWVINRADKALLTQDINPDAPDEVIRAIGLDSSAEEIEKIDSLAPDMVEDPPCVVADRTIKAYSAFTAWLKKCENVKLATGLDDVSKQHKDKLTKRVKAEVGYGTTEGEIHDAISVGILSKGSTLPKSMTEEEAGRWMDTVTIPTYKKIVELEVKVPLNTKQKLALISFCQNLGRGGLKSLINGEGRLNSGNYEDVPELIRQYCHVKGHKKPIKGLAIRRATEAKWFAEGTKEAAAKEKVLLAANR